MNYISDEDTCCSAGSISYDDEVHEIKKAWKVTNARKKFIDNNNVSKKTSHSTNSNIKTNSNHSNDLSHIDNIGLKHIINNQTKELTNIKQQLIEKEYELKEARYEINQFAMKEKKSNDDKLLIEEQNNEMIQKLKTKYIHQTTYNDDYLSLVRSEYDKIMNGIDMIYQAIFRTRNDNDITKTTTTTTTSTITSKSVVTKIHKQLFERVMQDVSTLKEVLSNSSSSSNTTSKSSSSSSTSFNDSSNSTSRLMKTNKSFAAAATATNSNVANRYTDSVLMDICHGLEEENKILIDTMDTMRIQVDEANREVAVNKLIPHYRLAILRSRTYACNLIEQLKREQATSQELRTQLDLTYDDLKKVVEEKRQMFAHLSTAALRSDEINTASSINDQFNIDEQLILKRDPNDHHIHHHQKHQQQQQQQQIIHDHLRTIHHETKEMGVNTDEEDDKEDDDIIRTTALSTNIQMNNSTGVSSNTTIDINNRKSDGISAHKDNIVETKLNDDNDDALAHSNVSSHVLDVMRRLLLSSKLVSVDGDNVDSLMMSSSSSSSDDHVTALRTVGLDSMLSSAAARLQEEMRQLDGDIDELKIKLRKAAIIKSNDIINKII